MAFIKAKNVNAYAKENGKYTFCIKLENGDHTWINFELLNYAVQHPGTKILTRQNTSDKEIAKDAE